MHMGHVLYCTTHIALPVILVRVLLEDYSDQLRERERGVETTREMEEDRERGRERKKEIERYIHI
jgi:hypothetical protein